MFKINEERDAKSYKIIHSFLLYYCCTVVHCDIYKSTYNIS
jgi:hypothetical protein